MAARDFIPESGIRLELESRTKPDVIRELVSLFGFEEETTEEIWRRLLLHERLGSTGIGKGIAIPYYRFDVLDRPRLGFGRVLKGVDFDALDGEPVHYFFILLGPKNETRNEFLPLLAKLANWFKKPGVGESLRQLEEPEDLLRLLDRENL